MDDPASEMLLNASAMIATEPAKIPITNFPMNSRTLSNIPVNPAREAYLPRVFTSEGLLFLPTKRRIKKFVIVYTLYEREIILSIGMGNICKKSFKVLTNIYRYGKIIDSIRE